MIAVSSLNVPDIVKVAHIALSIDVYWSLNDQGPVRNPSSSFTLPWSTYLQMDPTDLVVTAISLAWKVYVCCESAPRSFKQISAEVRSLHGLLKETQETVLTRSLPIASQERLVTILDGCTGVLKDLEAFVNKYEALGKYKWTLDRVTWGKEDVGELRARLTSNTVLLTGFLRYLTLCSFKTTYQSL